VCGLYTKYFWNRFRYIILTAFKTIVLIALLLECKICKTFVHWNWNTTVMVTVTWSSEWGSNVAAYKWWLLVLLYSKCSCCDLQTDALQNVAAISEFWRNGILLKNVWFSLQWCTVRVDVWLQIKILVSSITNITKKKTAIIIPNAVGIVTEDHKVLYCMSSAHCLVWFLLFCMSSVLLFPLSLCLFQ